MKAGRRKGDGVVEACVHEHHMRYTILLFASYTANQVQT